ncbi:stage II sporulation protein M [Thermophagus sp. OGC60D27]|uniref:stage II sporulation protein M n=1 Tax=Thermophagus sp. OGC60D27 TaxID=3458415 RepID=UPI004037BE15
MREISFIQQNRERWQSFEEKIANPHQMSPDELADQYIQLTDDLSYAKTFYPESSIVGYLNSLGSKAYYLIYQNKPEKSRRFFSFWTRELPVDLYESRYYFLLSFIVFVVSVIIGSVSAVKNDDFVRLVLGNQYVNMTLDNIEKGDPLAVYRQMGEVPMFLVITGNNIFVSFVVFVFGLLSPLGTMYHLFRNGVMIGAFQAFFYQHSLLTVSSLGIFLHGTLELSAIVLAGGAGILLGKSFIWPGSLPRKSAFIKGVRKGTKIMLGLVPFFMIAGFIESFITRYYNQIPLIVNLVIIIISLVLILGYFIYYPIYIHKHYNS